MLTGAVVNQAAGANAGRAYVDWGRSASTDPVELSAVAAGLGGFLVNGVVNQRVGWAVSAAGDVNGDGLADVIVGTGGLTSTERAYVIYGRTASTAVELSAVAEGSGGFAILAESGGTFTGKAVAGAGDVNGDGYADLIVGAPNFDTTITDAGRTYVVFGGTAMSTVSLSAVVGGTGGFVINGQSASDQSGELVSAAGDVNGDGLADLAIGQSLADPRAGTTARLAVLVSFSHAGSVVPCSG